MGRGWFIRYLVSASDATEEARDQRPLEAEPKSEPMLLRWLANTGGLEPAGDVGVAGALPASHGSMLTGVAVAVSLHRLPDAADGVGLVNREFRNKANGSAPPSRLLRFVNWRTCFQSNLISSIQHLICHF